MLVSKILIGIIFIVDASTLTLKYKSLNSPLAGLGLIQELDNVEIASFCVLLCASLKPGCVHVEWEGSSGSCLLYKGFKMAPAGTNNIR